MSFKEKLLQIIKALQTDYFTAKQLRGLLFVSSTVERRALEQALAELVNDCVLFFDEKNRRYRLLSQQEVGQAVFEGNARGFGFLLCNDGDLFVPASKTNGAFHRDTVMYRRIPGTQDEAEIVKIVSRGMTQIVGTFQKNLSVGFVLPDEKKFISDIFVPLRKSMGARDGQKVLVQINSYPADNRNNPEGEIIQILGYPNEKNVDMLSVAFSYGLLQQFPAPVQDRADKLPQSITQEEIVGRRDLREQRIFTIDGADAKDLDDAVSIVENADGTFTLGVHIADVSHYVKPSDDIDKEAFRRGTSVYLPEMVFPMLPTSLSNGICSLFPRVDRLTLSCQMTVDSRGEVVDFDLFPSVINSCHRLTYTAVQDILDGHKQTQAQYRDILPELFAMQKLAKILQQKRKKRGNIDFATKEVTFVHDEQGNVVDVVPVTAQFSNQIIEEFMILANETVAEFAENCTYPLVYRIHEKPDEQKLAVLYALLKGVGIAVKMPKVVHNSVFQSALEQAKQTQYFNLINDVMLRTMQKAKYSEVNSGHFGLASRCYCHFTSPIRRYPDLVVHRIVKTAILGKMTEKAITAYEQMAADCSDQANRTERNAVEAERKADDVKKCSYAQTIIGQSFTAIVSGVAENGIYAELPNTVEGFISVDKLGDRFSYNREQFCLYNGSIKYSLGDKIAITVSSVNKQACKIDFDLAKNID
ncbi:MAG: ribonuclease R [Clostridia bacterium]|nr:ribonuclease R [Clostridia bacterium]